MIDPASSSPPGSAALPEVPSDDPTTRAGPADVSAGTPPAAAPDPAEAPRPSLAERRAAERARRAEAERLDAAIARLSAHIDAATYRLLVMIRRFEATEGWHRQGFTSCAKWLSWRTGLAPGAARERVRVARALAGLPALSEALERGELSYSAARALTRVATPENEAELVEVARTTPAHQLERLVRAWRAADRSEAMELADEQLRHAARELSLTPEADGGWRIRGRLDPEVGAVVKKALEAASDALYRTAGEGADAPAGARRADALGLVAEAALGKGLAAGAGTPEGAEEAETDDGEAEGDAPTVVGRAGRFQVVVRVSAETLAGAAVGREASDGDVSADTSAGANGEGEDVPAETSTGTPPEPPHVAGGPPLVAETARRLACDAGVVTMVEDRAGRVLDVGRRTRTVPAALRRALDRRDRGCRFPGCGSRFCDAHHVTAWAAGGETKLDNLVLLCRHHHRRVHEEGWRVELVPADDGPPEVRVHRPDGRRLPHLPPPPAVPGGPAAALEAEQRGLGIDADTATPRWEGHPLDVDWALAALRRPATLERAAGLKRSGDPADDVSAGTDRQQVSTAASREGPSVPAGTSRQQLSATAPPSGRRARSGTSPRERVNGRNVPHEVRQTSQRPRGSGFGE